MEREGRLTFPLLRPGIPGRCDSGETQPESRAIRSGPVANCQHDGAIWAAIVEQNPSAVEAPEFDPLTASLGEDAQCFRGTLSIAGRRPIRHLVAISAELAKTRPGADPGGRRTILCDHDATFVLYRIAQRFGLPVVPEWADWFNEELRRRKAISPLVGLGCSPVLVSGTKKLFLLSAKGPESGMNAPQGFMLSPSSRPCTHGRLSS